MPIAIIKFQIPEDVHLLDKIVEVFEENGGLSEQSYHLYRDNYRHLVNESKNGIADVEFDDADNPIETLVTTVDLLKENKIAFLGVAHSFEQGSTDMRFEGRVYLYIPDIIDDEKNFPWVMGEPQLDEATLKILDYSNEDLAAVIDQFFSPEMQRGLSR